MTQAKNGTLLFEKQKVKKVQSVWGGQDLPKPYKEEDDDDVMKKETDVGWDPSNEVKKITPIKSMTELKSVQEFTKVTPVKSIEEIISMKEIKSIEEIKEKIAREFIRKHGLKNLIAGVVEVSWRVKLDQDLLEIESWRVWKITLGLIQNC